MISFILCLVLSLCFDSFCLVVNLAGGGLTSVNFLLSMCRWLHRTPLEPIIIYSVASYYRLHLSFLGANVIVVI